MHLFSMVGAFSGHASLLKKKKKKVELWLHLFFCIIDVHDVLWWQFFD